MSKKIFATFMSIILCFSFLFSLSPMAFAETELNIIPFFEQTVYANCGEEKLFSFVPEYSETYTFESLTPDEIPANLDTYGCILDSNQRTVLAENDDKSIDDRMFLVSYYLEEGKQYYLSAKHLAGTVSGQIKVLLTSEKSEKIESISGSTSFAFEQNRNGFQKVDKNGNDYFEYDYNKVLETLTLNAVFTDGSSKTWTYGGSNGVAKIDDIALYFSTNQASNHWVSGGENVFTVRYMGAKCDLNIVVLCNNHNYEQEVFVPNCTEEGYTLNTCTNCNHSYKTDIIPALGHNYEFIREIVPHSCTDNGLALNQCTRCGEFKELEVPAPGHDYDALEIVDPTCTEGGYTLKSCKICKVSYHAQEKPALGHDFDENQNQTIPPTCTEDGYILKKCKVCEEWVKIKNPDSPALGHKNTVTTKKATTSKNGSIVTKCSICGKTTTKKIYYPKTINISKTSIAYTGSNLKKPTISVKDSNGKVISSNNYTVSYINMSTNKKFTNLKAINKYKVKIVFKGNYSGTVYKYFTVVPKKPSIKTPTTKNKTITAKWGKLSSITGYQVVVSKKSNFSSSKTYTVKSESATSKKITGLKKGTKYYIKVRSYKKVKVDGKSKTIYSSYSSVKTIKCK